MFLELLDVAHRYGLATQHDQALLAKILAACEIGGPLTKDTWNGLIRRESLAGQPGGKFTYSVFHDFEGINGGAIQQRAKQTSQ